MRRYIYQKLRQDHGSHSSAATVDGAVPSIPGRRGGMSPLAAAWRDLSRINLRSTALVLRASPRWAHRLVSFLHLHQIGCLEIEMHRLRLVPRAVGTCSATFRLHLLQLLARLLAISQCVVCAERDLLSAGQQELLAAFHQVLLVERPWCHEILQHDHDHATRKPADRQAVRYSA